MQPTQPMSPSTPGSAPGVPAGTPPGGWTPGAGTPPPGHPFASPPPRRSRTPLYVGLGCGCLTILLCAVGIGVGYTRLVPPTPGEERASMALSPGQPFTLSYVQHGDERYAAWLDVATEAGTYQLRGPVLLSDDGTPFGQYTVDDDGVGPPVVERDREVRVDRDPAQGAPRTAVRLFPLPRREDGHTISLSGTLEGGGAAFRLYVTVR